MTHYYSPHTGEHIQTNTPADWMGTTATEPPTYNHATQGCFWNGAAWDVIEATPTSKTPREQISAIESSITQRRLREAVLSAPGAQWLADRDAEIQALRAQL